jgi:hypothetical protein
MIVIVIIAIVVVGVVAVVYHDQVAEAWDKFVDGEDYEPVTEIERTADELKEDWDAALDDYGDMRENVKQKE